MCKPEVKWPLTFITDEIFSISDYSRGHLETEFALLIDFGIGVVLRTRKAD
jgi:hypothetical protein